MADVYQQVLGGGQPGPVNFANAIRKMSTAYKRVKNLSEAQKLKLKWAEETHKMEMQRMKAQYDLAQERIKSVEFERDQMAEQAETEAGQREVRQRVIPELMETLRVYQEAPKEAKERQVGQIQVVTGPPGWGGIATMKAYQKEDPRAEAQKKLYSLMGELYASDPDMATKVTDMAESLVATQTGMEAAQIDLRAARAMAEQKEAAARRGGIEADILEKTGLRAAEESIKASEALKRQREAAAGKYTTEEAAMERARLDAAEKRKREKIDAVVKDIQTDYFPEENVEALRDSFDDRIRPLQDRKSNIISRLQGYQSIQSDREMRDLVGKMAEQKFGVSFDVTALYNDKAGKNEVKPQREVVNLLNELKTVQTEMDSEHRHFLSRKSFYNNIEFTVKDAIGAFEAQGANTLEATEKARRVVPEALQAASEALLPMINEIDDADRTAEVIQKTYQKFLDTYGGALSQDHLTVIRGILQNAVLDKRESYRKSGRELFDYRAPEE